jgi:hypothetical protein
VQLTEDFHEAELIQLIATHLDISIDELTGVTIDSLGSRLPAYEHPGSDFFTTPPYWKNLKEEFRLLVCTDDLKYKDLRENLVKAGDKSYTTVVAAIAAAIAATLSLTVGVLVPFCALCLLALLRLGKEAYCKTVALNIVVNNVTK